MKNAKRHSRGTIISYFLVLISVIVTGLITTIAITSGNETQAASMTLKRDQAFFAAESAIQRAWWMLQSNNNWRRNTTDTWGTVGSANYTMTCVGDWNAPCLLTATGKVGTDVSVTITAAVSPAVIVPAISLGNNFSNSGNVTITGDVQAKGNIDTHGRMRENGSIVAGGTVSTTGSVDITGASIANVPGITVPVVDMAWLRSHATQVINVPNGKKPTDVASINLGNGGIVYFSGGDINFKGNVTITGSGTIVADGNVSIQSAASFGSSSQPANVNLVTAGSLDVSGYLGVLGSIYVGGSITKHGGLDITGVVVAQSNLDTNGGLNITRAQPPAFDPRSQAAGAGTMQLSRFTGPIF